MVDSLVLIANRSLQAVGQMIFTGLSLAQYLCVIDFLREHPILLFIRILYFHNPSCGQRVNIGNVIDGIPNQAFVFIPHEPLPVTRLFLINCVNLSLSVFLLITSTILMVGSARGSRSRLVRWPWLTIVVCSCAVDVIATITFISDTFFTETLTDIMTYIGGRTSGVGNAEISTAWTAWIMAIIYSRFGVFFVLNIILLVTVVIHGNLPKVDAGNPPPTPPMVASLFTEDEERSFGNEWPVNIPRAGLRETFRLMKNRILKPKTPSDSSRDRSLSLGRPTFTAPAKSKSRTVIFPKNLLSLPQRLENIMADNELVSEGVVDTAARRGTASEEQGEPNSTVLRATHSLSDLAENIGKNAQNLNTENPNIQSSKNKSRTVIFPENLLSLPQRLENIIQKHQRSLHNTVVDTSARRTAHKDTTELPSRPLRTSLSLPDLAGNEDQKIHDFNRERRGTATELQGQLPWAYIPAPANRMRDRLPSDEDLPPVPLPDYSAKPFFRKTSVHRAASSVSSLAVWKRDHLASHASRQCL
ncbi:uncharacterized protein [Battus philenor]|uniref:uncharacterized protein n=1 Tax=Battus philenor TaxID=42288 RepID=UPI0035D12E50